MSLLRLGLNRFTKLAKLTKLTKLTKWTNTRCFHSQVTSRSSAEAKNDFDLKKTIGDRMDSLKPLLNTGVDTVKKGLFSTVDFVKPKITSTANTISSKSTEVLEYAILYRLFASMKFMMVRNAKPTVTSYHTTTYKNVHLTQNGFGDKIINILMSEGKFKIPDLKIGSDGVITNPDSINFRVNITDINKCPHIFKTVLTNLDINKFDIKLLRTRSSYDTNTAWPKYYDIFVDITLKP